ncbi:hypothetical protein Kisp01_59460 [Kineosporia sp. NBRC 101677]|uniref:glycosyl hydrolase n=1 Tax=Kineosporia sp. NBRC 101677 TaxID=3032197 RepID=UPI0024A0C490|nr:glycosyl hydrolase [Kineosporia sp. NBRC 101677]GLY18932.1 hypothetical protein Kisp01_59460 [Kineosporia sp. NBRC 101677]
MTTRLFARLRAAATHSRSARPPIRRIHTAALIGVGTVAALGAGLLAPTSAQAAAPDFGPNVVVFDPSMNDADIQSRLDTVQAAQKDNEFGTERYAFLFRPGSYDVDAKLGYYTSVAGLGADPGDVVIKGGVRVEGRNDALTNFWRSAENLSIEPTGGNNRWAVSQASPLRRVHVRGNLQLHTADYAYASGGYIGDTKVDGKVDATTQQQYYTRDSTIGSWSGSVWNMVFSGTNGAPPQSFPKPQMTTLGSTPVSREKPFLTVDSAGEYSVFVPALRRDAKGASWDGGKTPGSSLPIKDFYIAKPGDSAAKINAQLSAGKHLIITPGIYRLSQPLAVKRANTVVLGLGMATLVPTGGTAAVTVADVDGVRLAGLIVDAGTTNSSSLVTVGSGKTSVKHTANPTSLHDVFFRVGGATAGQAATSLQVNSNDVLLDHIWAWRADHGAGAGWTTNPGATGVRVNGDRVTALGLFVEHYQKFQTIWNGQDGRTIFYQSELPYDPPNQAAWKSTGTTNGYASYKVDTDVKTHEAWGLGVYSFFNKNQPVFTDRAIEVPDRAGVKLRDMVTVFLSGSGGINHVVNRTGAPVTAIGDTTYVVEYAGAAPTAEVNSSPKKGIAAIKYSGDQARLTGAGAKWFYNWSPNGESGNGAEFVPQAWNAPSAETVAALTEGRKQEKYENLLGFNEPDLGEQANMSVKQALDAWPDLESTGLVLGSPAPANYWGGWLDEFMTGAAERKYRVDFIALHIYPDWTNPGAIEEVRGTLADAWNKWHKPIWLTEIGTVDTSAWKPMYGTPSQAKADSFMQKLVPLLESLPYVERYSWFADNCATTESCKYSTLYSSTNELTSLGQAFAAGKASGPAGRFRLVNEAQPTLALHAAGETYPSGGNRVAVTPANWGWDQQRWDLADAGGGFYTVTNVATPSTRLTMTAEAYPGGTGNHEVAAAPTTGGDEQLWQVTRTSDGYYRLINKARGTALQSTFDAYNGRTDSFNVAGTSASFVNDQQSWALVPE